MTKNQTNILKIIAGITFISLAIFVIYSFTSSENNEDANQNDPPKEIQNEDGASAAGKSPETTKAENDSWLSGRKAVVAGCFGVFVYLWRHKGDLVNSAEVNTAAALWNYIAGDFYDMLYTAGYLLLFSGVGLLTVNLLFWGIATMLEKELLPQSVINYLPVTNALAVVLSPSAILLQIGYLIYARRAYLNNNNGDNKDTLIAALDKTLMLMGVGVLVGLMMGGLTFAYCSHMGYYKEVTSPNGIYQFFAELNVALHKHEMIGLAGLLGMAALLSPKAWAHDFKSWETAAILATTVVGAVLSIQLLHTGVFGTPDKCTLIGALLGLGSLLYAYAAHLSGGDRKGFVADVTDNWWKTIFVALCVLGLPIVGYLFDTIWSEDIKGYEQGVYGVIGVCSFVNLFLGYSGGWRALWIALPVIVLAEIVIYFHWQEITEAFPILTSISPSNQTSTTSSTEYPLGYIALGVIALIVVVALVMTRKGNNLKKRIKGLDTTYDNIPAIKLIGQENGDENQESETATASKPKGLHKEIKDIADTLHDAWFLTKFYYYYWVLNEKVNKDKKDSNPIFLHLKDILWIVYNDKTGKYVANNEQGNKTKGKIFDILYRLNLKAIPVLADRLEVQAGLFEANVDDDNELKQKKENIKDIADLHKIVTEKRDNNPYNKKLKGYANSIYNSLAVISNKLASSNPSDLKTINPKIGDIQKFLQDQKLLSLNINELIDDLVALKGNKETIEGLGIFISKYAYHLGLADNKAAIVTKTYANKKLQNDTILGELGRLHGSMNQKNLKDDNKLVQQLDNLIKKLKPNDDDGLTS